MKNFKGLAMFFYSIATFFMGFGFYKLFVYENSTVESFQKNAYVGGDAYNYIINACQSTGYFVLSLLFVVLGCTALIITGMYQSKIIEIEVPKPTTELIENKTE